MAYKHVMAAVDLSDEANQVLEEAKQIAADHGAKLSLITVVKPLTQVYGGPEVFRRLVEKAHDEGIAVIVDVVYNHFGHGYHKNR